MELDAKAWGLEAIKVVVDNRGVSTNVKAKLAPIDLCNEGVMVSQLVLGLK